jgi:hypothetical protein
LLCLTDQLVQGYIFNAGVSRALHVVKKKLASPHLAPALAKDIESLPRKSCFRLSMASNDPDNPYYKGQDAYQILDVPRSADKKTIKAAYRKGI